MQTLRPGEVARFVPERSTRAEGTPPELPLSGVRVVELCWVWAGPLLGQFLADLGAEVVKCEWYARHDPYRTRGVERLRGRIPVERHRESSFSFHSLNRNKVGFAANLKSDEGLAQLKSLIEVSDVLIENFTVGTLEHLGLGYEVLRELNERLVVVSLSGFGKGSRLEAMRAYGLVISALGGAEAPICDEGEFVGSPTFVISDPNAAAFGLYAAIAGLLHSEAAGAGTTFLASQVEAIMSLMEAERPADAAPAVTDRRLDIMVEAADGRHVAVSVDPDVDGLDADEARSLATKLASDALVDELASRGVPAAVVVDVAETPASRAFEGAGVRLNSHHPVTGPEALVAAPWRVNGARAPLRKTAPLLGESDLYVLRTMLGLSDDEAARRRQVEDRG